MNDSHAMFLRAQHKCVKRIFVDMLFILFHLFTGLFLAEDSVVIHDLHLSKSQINYNQDNQSVEITLHLFIDDLEIALSEKGHSNLSICTKKESNLAEQYMAQYIEDKMQVAIYGKPYMAEFLGKESSEDLQGVWCYLEITEISKPESVIVEIDFFNELYSDQKNVVNIKVDDDSQEYYLLNKKKTTAELSIK